MVDCAKLLRFTHGPDTRGITKSSPDKTQQFYVDLQKFLHKYRGYDIVIGGDFNAKVGKSQNPAETFVGQCARGIRNENGHFLSDLCMNNRLILSNTFFKHKASHITTWESVRNGKPIYNQIDYILLPNYRRANITNARSYKPMHISTDHRLVICTYRLKLFCCKGPVKHRKPNHDPRIQALSEQQKLLFVKIRQSTNATNIGKWKKQRNQILNKIKKYLAEKQEQKELDDANQLNAQSSSHAFHKVLKKFMPREGKDSIKSPCTAALKDHFNSMFNGSPIHDPHIHVTHTTAPMNETRPITANEAESAMKMLAKKQSVGPDGLKLEDLIALGSHAVASTLNEMINTKSEVLTTGFLVPIRKPGKNALEVSSYRPIILMNAYRKLLSRIVLTRIEHLLDEEISYLQHAYTKHKSTAEVVLAHKLLKAYTEEFDAGSIVVAGIDMSKAFDTVPRDKLIDILHQKFPYCTDISLVKLLLSNTKLTIKKKNSLSSPFPTTIGVPQGDCLSPKLFTFYLNNAINDLTQNHAFDLPSSLHVDHTYHLNPTLPKYFAYADDVDFICRNEEEAEKVVETAAEVFKSHNLFINSSKTEFSEYQKDGKAPRALKSTKKLGKILDEDAEFVRRKSLSNIALHKLRRIWKNRYIKISTKVTIYNTYVRSILTYNCGTWAMNKTSDNQIDGFHRRQLRTVLNRSYPKHLSNDLVYSLTKQSPLSKFVSSQRKSLLGHALRRKNATSRTMNFI